MIILTGSKRCPAAKSFRRGLEGELVKEPIQIARLFRVEQRNIQSIEDLAATLQELSAQPHKFVIRGEVCPGVDIGGRVRRLLYADGDDRATFRSARHGRRWICFDFDAIECGQDIDPIGHPTAALNALRALLPPEFQDASYFAQWSGSAGINGWKSISAHLWFMLDRAVTDEELLIWSETLHLPVDRRLFHPIQPHFTAVPVFADGITDPCPQRNYFQKGTRSQVSIDLTMIRMLRHDSRRVENDTDETQTLAKRTRSKARTRRPPSRPRDPQMGSGRCEDQRPRIGRTPIYGLSIELNEQTGELVFSD